MAYRYEVSYPFLDVARRHHIRYEDVLMAAVFLQYDLGNGHYPGPIPDEVDEDVVPLAAMREIAILVDTPVAERGGRTEVPDPPREDIQSKSMPGWSTDDIRRYKDV